MNLNTWMIFTFGIVSICCSKRANIVKIQYYNESLDWMKNLSDTKTIAQISIPGTHDSVSFFGGPLVITQTLGLRDQLNFGIRVFDIRCRHVSNECAIHHGPIFQKTFLNNVLSTVTTFLKTFKSEFVLMRIKNECERGSLCRDGGKNTRSLKETIRVNLNSYLEFIFENFTKIPTIGEARGKIIILDEIAGGTFGFRWNQCPSCLQDKFKIPTVFDIEEKKNHVKSHLKKTSSDISDAKLYINFLSGSSAGTWPKLVADQVNIWFIRELRENNLNYKKLGIIMMDFPNIEQIMLIIQNNFNFNSSFV